MKITITQKLPTQLYSEKELRAAWHAAGEPSQRGPDGGKKFFGMNFERFYLMCRCYPLKAPDLSMAASTGLGFDKNDGYRALVFAAGAPGYFWVALQRATFPNLFQKFFPMETFYAPCAAKDVVPAIARWAPGVKLHWTSSPGPQNTMMPYNWNPSSQYKRGKPRLQFRYADTFEGPRIKVNVAEHSVTTQKKYRLVGACARPSKLDWVKSTFAGEADPHDQDAGLLLITPRLLKLICRWSAKHFHNRVLKESK